MSPAAPPRVAFRDATLDDLETLVDLHVRLWARTYPDVQRPPTHAIRRHQWERAFERRDSGVRDAWFCAVLAEAEGRPVGFSKAIVADHSEFEAELSKIYLEWDFHGRGVGAALLRETVRRVREHGLGSMVLFADPGNPHIVFYERMGAERIGPDDGSATFGWRDLARL